MAAGHDNETDVAVLTERVNTLIKRVDEVLPLAADVAVQKEQISQLRRFACDINTRQWWLIGMMITTLVGIAIKVCAG